MILCRSFHESELSNDNRAGVILANGERYVICECHWNGGDNCCIDSVDLIAASVCGASDSVPSLFSKVECNLLARLRPLSALFGHSEIRCISKVWDNRGDLHKGHGNFLVLDCSGFGGFGCGINTWPVRIAHNFWGQSWVMCLEEI